MREHRHNSKIGIFQERQNKFSIYIIFTYTFNVVGPPGGHFWEYSYDDLAAYREKIALFYESNNLQTPIFELWRSRMLHGSIAHIIHNAHVLLKGFVY